MFTEDWGLVSKEISKTVCYYVTVSIVTLGFSSRCDSKKRRKFLYETAGRATARETLGIDPGPSRPREVERGDGSLAAFLARVSFALFFFVFFFRALLLCPVEHLSTILLTLPRRNPQRKRLFFSLDSFPRMFDRLIATSPRSLSFSARSSREKLERVSPRSSVNFIEDQRFKDRKKKRKERSGNSEKLGGEGNSFWTSSNLGACYFDSRWADVNWDLPSRLARCLPRELSIEMDSSQAFIDVFVKCHSAAAVKHRPCEERWRTYARRGGNSARLDLFRPRLAERKDTRYNVLRMSPGTSREPVSVSHSVTVPLGDLEISSGVAIPHPLLVDR